MISPCNTSVHKVSYTNFSSRPNPGRRRNDVKQRPLTNCQRLIYATQHPVCVCTRVRVYVSVCVRMCACVRVRAYVCVASIHLDAKYSKFIVSCSPLLTNLENIFSKIVLNDLHNLSKCQ